MFRVASKARRRIAYFVLFAVTASLGFSADSLHAAALTSGGGFFNASGVLPLMPCNTCGLLLTGTMGVTLHGLDTAGLPFVATWPDPSVNPLQPDMTAGVVYTETCGPTADTPPSLTGSASGYFTVANGLLVRPNGVSHSATLTGSLDWQRVGAVLVLDISATDVDDGSSNLVASTANPGITLLDGEGAAAYDPNSWTGNCIDLAHNVPVQIAGTLTQPI
jgi:hypothetical protein